MLKRYLRIPYTFKKRLNIIFLPLKNGNIHDFLKYILQALNFTYICNSGWGIY